MELIRPRKCKLSLDMAPLIDVVFQLLIFFMLTSAFSQPAMNIRLPQASSQDSREQERIVILIQQDGQMFLNGKSIVPNNLKKTLEPLLKSSSSKAVHIKADESTSYKYFVEAMDTARQAGATQVNVVHER
jgi:biopolymer transport protein ExbD